MVCNLCMRVYEHGCMQMGTLSAGNHYAEIQVVEEVFDSAAARKMGIDKVGQVCIIIHSGSRGRGQKVHPLTHLTNQVTPLTHQVTPPHTPGNPPHTPGDLAGSALARQAVGEAVIQLLLYSVSSAPLPSL